MKLIRDPHGSLFEFECRAFGKLLYMQAFSESFFFEAIVFSAKCGIIHEVD